MKTVLSIISLCFPFLLTAQFSEPQLLIDCETCGIASVLSEDFDGDGDNDVLSASIEDDKLAWYQNDGTGKFSAQIIITVGKFEIVDAEIADMDNDGDIVALSERQVLFYANDGSGNFAAPEVLIVADTLQHDLFLEDLNQDGLLDILVITDAQKEPLFPGIPSLDQELYWYQQTENLAFSEATLVSSNLIPFSFLFRGKKIEFIDFDFDGDTDIIGGGFLDNQLWFENDGMGNFEEHSLHEEGLIGRLAGAIDYDNDGAIDLFGHQEKFFRK